VTAVAFSPDGSVIASADSDTAIRVFDAHTGNLKWRFDELMVESFAVDFTADDKFVIAGGASKSLILLGAISGKELRSFPKQKNVVRYIEVSPDGNVVAVEHFDENGSNVPAPIMVFDISAGNVRSQWTLDVPIIGTGWIGNGHMVQ
jgi:WD40 repeat protein